MFYERTMGWCVVAIVLTASGGVRAATIQIPKDFPTIQAGIDAAVAGDEVVVAPGTYVENINFLGKAITVRSSNPNDAAVVLSTIIDGGGSGTVVLCTSGEGSDTVLSGFVVTGGVASFGSGGGMANFDSSPTVTNCSFIENTAVRGGGMANVNSSPTVTNCSFTGNTADFGGGIFNNVHRPTVTNTEFCINTPDAIDGPFTDGGGNSLEYCGPPIPAPETCPADLDGDDAVDFDDVLAVLTAWGPCP